MEDTVVNRFTLLLIVSTIAGGNAFGQNALGQSHASGRAGIPPIRVAQSPTVPARSNAVPRPARPVGRLVSQQSIVADGGDEVIYDDGSEGAVLGESYNPNEGLAEIGGGCTSCGGGGCSSCGGVCGSPFEFDLCNPGALGGRQLCIGLPSHGWVSVEYLNWYQDGMETPALVTSTVGTAATRLYGGNNDILEGRINGTRVRFGWWFVNHPNLGIEGEYLGFGTRTEDFNQGASATAIIGRPFYNAVTGRDDSELVSSPGVITGRVTSIATSKLDGAAVRFRKLLCCSSDCTFSPIACGPVPTQSRIDATLGWRFYQLKEGLDITENLNGVTPPGTFLLNDSFRTRNQFNGAELGVHWMKRRGYWSLDMLMRLGLGNTRQQVDIIGSTVINGVANAAPNGGLLAQRTNSGTFVRNEFGVVPELGATLGYQLTPRMRLTAGYSFIYWSNVVRPGDQIDTTVNPRLFPPENPRETTFLNPRFAFQDSDYWVQGLSLGGDYRW